MIIFSSNPQMISDKLPEIFSAFNRPVISQKQVSQKDKDTDIAVLNKKDNNIDADTQHTKPIISQPKKKLGFWKNTGLVALSFLGVDKAMDFLEEKISGRFQDNLVTPVKIKSYDEYIEIENAIINSIKKSGLTKKGIKLQKGDNILILKGEKQIRRTDNTNKNDIINLMKKTNINKNKSLKRRLKEKILIKDKITTYKTKKFLHSNLNACFIPSQNKIFMSENHDIAPAVFHEIGHAIDHNKGIFLRSINYLRAAIQITKLPLLLLAIALIKEKRAENEKPVGVWDKTTMFIKENIGKLVFVTLLPKYINEISASVHGNKLASKHLSPELLCKVKSINKFSKIAYSLNILFMTVSAILMVKIKDKLAQFLTKK